MRKIVAATDLSGRAAWAAERAAMLAAAGKASLDLVHVVGRGPLEALRRMVAAGAQDTVDRLLAQSELALSRAAAELARRHGIEVRTHLPTGTAFREIVECARACDADLLVAGAHGGHFVRELTLGTTAARLLEQAPCPVLVVRREPLAEYRRVLVPVDFSAASAAALQWAAVLAPDAQVHVLHAYEVPFEDKMRFAGVSDSAYQHYRTVAGEEARREMEAFIGRAALALAPAQCIVEYGYAPEVIGRVAARIDADLIVLGAQGRSDLSYLLVGSVTQHTMRDAACDVAAFRNRGDGAKN